MRYVEDGSLDKANFCVTVYDARSGMWMADFCFILSDGEDEPAYAMRYVCNHFPEYCSWGYRIQFFKVMLGRKVGAC